MLLSPMHIRLSVLEPIVQRGWDRRQTLAGCPSLSSTSSIPIVVEVATDFSFDRSERVVVGSIFEYRIPRSRVASTKKSAAKSSNALLHIGRLVRPACPKIEKLFGLFDVFLGHLVRQTLPIANAFPCFLPFLSTRRATFKVELFDKAMKTGAGSVSDGQSNENRSRKR